MSWQGAFLSGNIISSYLHGRTSPAKMATHGHAAHHHRFFLSVTGCDPWQCVHRARYGVLQCGINQSNTWMNVVKSFYKFFFESKIMKGTSYHPGFLFNTEARVSLLKTSHFRHTFILLLQLAWGFPWRRVPLMNQQRLPDSNSHAGQSRRVSIEQFRTSQQDRASPAFVFFNVRRKSICRSMCTGTLRHPCSKL